MFRITFAAVTAFACAASPLRAADWHLAGLATGSGNRGVTYVDIKSLRQAGGMVRFRSEQHLEAAEQGMNRILAVSEVDCSRMTVMVLRAQYFYNKALIAMVITPRKDHGYSSTTSVHWLTRRICSGDFLSGPIADRTLDAERMFSLDWSPFAQRLAIIIPQSHERTQVASIASGTEGRAPPP